MVEKNIRMLDLGRPGVGRPAFSRRSLFFRYLKRNASSVKYQNRRFSELESMFPKATRKSIKRWIETMTEENRKDLEKKGIKLEIREIKFRDSTLKYLYIDPPGVFVEGYWPVFPVLRSVVEDAVTLALRGELLERWDERPRFPMVRALRERFLED